MKFYLLISFSLLISADLSFGKSRSWRLQIATPATTPAFAENEDAQYFIPTVDDITDTLSKNIARTLKEFATHNNEWINNKISFNNEGPIDTTGLSFSQDNYQVTFSNLHVEDQNVGDRSGIQHITCSVSDNLKIQMPFNGRRLWLHGDVDIAQNETGMLLLPTRTHGNHFNVYLNDLTFSMTTKPNFNIGEVLPNNQTEIDIDYTTANIDLSTTRLTASVTAKAVAYLIDEIQLYLKTAVEEKLTTIIQEKISFLSLFTTCMHPKNGISSSPHLLLKEQNHYYAIAANKIELVDSIKLNTDVIKIKGLSNFTNINFSNHNSYNSDASFSLRIDDLKGESGWNYESDEIPPQQFTPFQFTIDYVTIRAEIDGNYLTLNNLETYVGTISCNFSDTAEVLIKMILKKKLKNIIASSITTSLLASYPQV